MIRPATLADEPKLRALDLATWSTLSSPAPVPAPDQPFELDGVFVAELEDGIAGFVRIGQALPIEASRHVLEIKGLSVSAAHRRRGVGRALVHTAIRRARGRWAPADAARAGSQHGRPLPLRRLRLRDRGRPARVLPARWPLRRRRHDGARPDETVSRYVDGDTFGVPDVS